MMKFLLTGLATTFAFASFAGAAPNIIFVLTDDLGYGDLGIFHQNARDNGAGGGTAGDGLINGTEAAHIHTPHLDTLAREGAMMTRHYSSAPVCAPARGSLLLGRDQGHANVRDNSFDKALDDNHTLGRVMQSAGYSTAIIGKWGVQGSPEFSSAAEAFPTKRGFDFFFGYLDHGAGHRHYPKEDGALGTTLVLWENSTNITANADKCYSTDLFTARAKKWIVDHNTATPTKPFFLYLSYTAPHAALEVATQAYPSFSGGNNSLTGGMQWLGTPGNLINTASGTVNSYIHPQFSAYNANGALARHGSMVRRIDNGIGDLKQLLSDLNIDQNTIIVFTSDNGPHHEGGYGGVVANGPNPVQDPQNFQSYGNMDGTKRDHWEAGIRVPTIAWWPGNIDNSDDNTPINSTRPSAFHDWMATFIDAAGNTPPSFSNGVSLLPELTGAGTQRDKGYLYFEYRAGGFNTTQSYSDFDPSHRGQTRNEMQTIFLDDPLDGIRYKGVRYNVSSHSQDFRIYDVDSDPGEINDLAASHSALQQQMKDKVLQVRIDGDYSRSYMSSQNTPSVGLVGTVNGLNYKAYTGTWDWVPETAYLTAAATGTSTGLDLTKRTRDDDIALEFTGYISVPADGTYTFQMSTDSSVGTNASGGMLWIHDAHIIDDDFKHSGAARSGTMRLKAGLHPIRVIYKHATGSHDINLQYSGPGISLQSVPASAFFIDGVPGTQPPASWKMEEGSGTTIKEEASNIDSDAFGTGVAWSTDTPGPGSAASLSFPGTAAGNFGTNRSAADLGIDGSNAKTITGWIKTSATSSQMFFGWTPSNGLGAGQDLRLGLNASGHLRLEVTSGFALHDTTALNDGQWHMVGVVIEAGDTTSTVEFYIDGTLSNPTSSGTQAIATAATGPAPRGEVAFGIGNPGATQQLWNGQIDEVRVFSEALTESALDAIRDSIITTPPQPPSAHWPLDEGSGTNITETSTSVVSDTFGAGVTWSSDVPGPASAASLSFANGGGVGTNLDSTATGISGSGAKTITGWIKTTTTAQDAFFGYSPSGGSGPGQDIRMLVNGNGGDTSGKLRVEVSSGGFEIGSGLNNGNWHMVAIIINANDGINDVDTYIDGTYTTRSAGGQFINTATGNEIFLGTDGNASRHFAGLLDDVRIFDRALDDTELDALMAAMAVAPPFYPVWIDGFFPGETDPGIIGFDADPDQDGLENGIELLLGTNPALAGDAQATTPGIDGSDFILSFERADESLGALDVTVQLSRDLDVWPPIDDIIIGVDTASSGPGVTIIDNGATDTVQIAIPTGIDPLRFARLQVTPR